MLTVRIRTEMELRENYDISTSRLQGVRSASELTEHMYVRLSGLPSVLPLLPKRA